MTIRLPQIPVIVLAGITAIFIAGAALAGQTTVCLALQWFPQAQFAGYYTALDRGFYAEEGLDAVIALQGPGALTALDSGKAQVATGFLSSAVVHLQKGIPLVNIAQMIQHSSIMIVARTDAGIRSIRDFDNRKITMWDNEFLVQPLALFRQLGIRVLRIPMTGSLELFLRNGVPGTMAMWYNEYHTLLSSGLRETDLVPFFLKDTDFDFPEDGIYCRREFMDANPGVVQGFVRASLRGWQYAFDHEDEALAGVERRMAQKNLPVSRAHQRWMLRRIKDLMAPGPGARSMGILDRDAFFRVVTVLHQAGVIRTVPEYDSFYRGETHVP
ncbi:MAG: ABC transporter substrate-binding protein [Pseudomonadota bacterium]